ncbi:MFS transporter [Beijerinckia sp. L45]|uniref:MFS transporter n=1 Tax=Beijerinckia sp. L45 TaxID=1641855 RepID=UPI00131E33B4|nr:MFS transporter [Beijerinckia sp. L45]
MIHDRISADEIRAPIQQSLTRRHWAVLAITMLLWMFDGYETYALLLTIGPSLHELVPASQLHDLPRFAAYLISLTLFGWAIGGVIGGLVGDRIGRRYTMIGSVVLYSLFTGSSAFAHSWETLALTRFLTGVGLGAEWGVGTSLLQEVWPDRLRTKAAGVLQAAFSGGFVVASLLWLAIGGASGGTWRWMYVAGIIPAIFVILVNRMIPESDRWSRAASSGPSIGILLKANRRNLALATLVSASITVGFWAISSWVPTYVATLTRDPKNAVFYAGLAGLLFAIGEIIGCVAFGLLAERWGRRGTLIFYLAGSIIITPILFLLVSDAKTFVVLQIANGFLTGGLYGWFAIHPPELFPTSIRSSAISIIFNSARFLAMLGPLLSSAFIAFFGGYGEAATIFSGCFAVGIVAVLFLPETRGKPLPA